MAAILSRGKWANEGTGNQLANHNSLEEVISLTHWGWDKMAANSQTLRI